jgi:hypothetical protein
MLFTNIVLAYSALASLALAVPMESGQGYVANLMGDNKEADVDTVAAAIIADVARTEANVTSAPLGARDADAEHDERDFSDAELDSRDIAARDLTGRCLPWKTAKSKGVPIVPNGCGPKWASWVPEFSYGKCCDSHDICYSTCSRSRVSCDSAFLTCMIATCHSKYKPWNPKRYACDGGAGVYYRAVRGAAGAVAFGIANKKHCKCV